MNHAPSEIIGNICNFLGIGDTSILYCVFNRNLCHKVIESTHTIHVSGSNPGRNVIKIFLDRLRENGQVLGFICLDPSHPLALFPYLDHLDLSILKFVHISIVLLNWSDKRNNEPSSIVTSPTDWQNLESFIIEDNSVNPTMDWLFDPLRQGLKLKKLQRFHVFSTNSKTSEAYSKQETHFTYYLPSCMKELSNIEDSNTKWPEFAQLEKAVIRTDFWPRSSPLIGLASTLTDLDISIASSLTINEYTFSLTEHHTSLLKRLKISLRGMQFSDTLSTLLAIAPPSITHLEVDLPKKISWDILDPLKRLLPTLITFEVHTGGFPKFRHERASVSIDPNTWPWNGGGCESNAEHNSLNTTINNSKRGSTLCSPSLKALRLGVDDFRFVHPLKTHFPSQLTQLTLITKENFELRPHQLPSQLQHLMVCGPMFSLENLHTSFTSSPSPSEILKQFFHQYPPNLTFIESYPIKAQDLDVMTFVDNAPRHIFLKAIGVAVTRTCLELHDIGSAFTSASIAAACERFVEKRSKNVLLQFDFQNPAFANDSQEIHSFPYHWNQMKSHLKKPFHTPFDQYKRFAPMESLLKDWNSIHTLFWPSMVLYAHELIKLPSSTKHLHIDLVDITSIRHLIENEEEDFPENPAHQAEYDLFLNQIPRLEILEVTKCELLERGSPSIVNLVSKFIVKKWKLNANPVSSDLFPHLAFAMKYLVIPEILLSYEDASKLFSVERITFAAKSWVDQKLENIVPGWEFSIRSSFIPTSYFLTGCYTDYNTIHMDHYVLACESKNALKRWMQQVRRRYPVQVSTLPPPVPFSLVSDINPSHHNRFVDLQYAHPMAIDFEEESEWIPSHFSNYHGQHSFDLPDHVTSLHMTHNFCISNISKFPSHLKHLRISSWSVPGWFNSPRLINHNPLSFDCAPKFDHLETIDAPDWMITPGEFDRLPSTLTKMNVGGQNLKFCHVIELKKYCPLLDDVTLEKVIPLDPCFTEHVNTEEMNLSIAAEIISSLLPYQNLKCTFSMTQIVLPECVKVLDLRSYVHTRNWYQKIGFILKRGGHHITMECATFIDINISVPIYTSPGLTHLKVSAPVLKMRPPNSVLPAGIQIVEMDCQDLSLYQFSEFVGHFPWKKFLSASTTKLVIYRSTTEFDAMTKMNLREKIKPRTLEIIDPGMTVSISVED